MIVLGSILLVVGLLVASLHVLFVIGLILLIAGVVLALLGAAGRQVGGRRHWSYKGSIQAGRPGHVARQPISVRER
jgi:hypothetical protein